MGWINNREGGYAVQGWARAMMRKLAAKQASGAAVVSRRGGGLARDAVVKMWC